MLLPLTPNSILRSLSAVIIAIATPYLLKSTQALAQTIDECSPAYCYESSYIYSANNSPGFQAGTIFEGTLEYGQLHFNELFSTGYSTHIACNSNSRIIYAVASDGSGISTYNLVGQLQSSHPLSNLGTITAVAWNWDDELVYAGSQNQNKIYTINPQNGATTVFASNVPVEGGDLVFNGNGNLLLIERGHNQPSQVYRVEAGNAVPLYQVVPEVNGAALTGSGQLIVAEAENANYFYQYAADGSNETLIEAFVSGEPLTLLAGDLTRMCDDPTILSVAQCPDFRQFYIADNNPGCEQGTVFEFESNGFEMVMTPLFSTGIPGHLAFNSEELLLYVLSGDGSAVTTFDMEGNTLNVVDLSGMGLTPAVAWNRQSGLLYVGSASQDRIYTVDPVDGTIVLIADDVPVQGGDLAFDNIGQLYLFSRNNDGPSQVYEISGGEAEPVFQVASGVNGASPLPGYPDGFVVAEGNGSHTFWTYPDHESDGIPVDVTLNGEPFDIYDGDMAGGCSISQPSPIDNCYANQLYGDMYIEGVQANGSMLPADRTNPTRALYAPEMDNTENFVSLGYGGSITLRFQQFVINYPGNDLAIVETSYGEPACGSYPEYADVEVSVSGNSWCSLGTICQDEALDIGDAGFDFIKYIRISNNDELSQTPDGYDVDGVVRLQDGCGDGYGQGIIAGVQRRTSSQLNRSPEIKAFPNPVSSRAQAQVQFTVHTDTHVSVEVFDAAGMRVARLFNQYANAGRYYQRRLNVGKLSQGLYFCRLTTGSGRNVMSKIIVNR